MGEGDGAKNISDEIEDEDMMDGYQNEEKHEKEGTDDEEGKAMDVSFDMDTEATKENETEEEAEKEGLFKTSNYDIEKLHK